jgi:chromosome segregation protein
MYLKRLEITGFKSFASKTVLDFLPPKNGLFSVTAIVGPNGSGKSNVTDAIRWVMGETSLKNIRGKKSEDVIFNGSEAKGALSAAEVTMTLDNSNKVGGLDFAEIAITRRLYRSGESEYLINNSAVRLLDIHLLLAKAQFAEHSYSIVSQGMIDRLLTVTTAERKEFFDEASGIKEFQIKRHQASLKLDRTDENIKQAETLLQEVEPRLKILARQVKKLEQRQELEVELLQNQEKYYATLHDRSRQEVTHFSTQLAEVEQKYRAVFEALTKVQNDLAELARSETRQENFEKLQSRYQEAVRISNDFERQLAILEGQLQTEYSQAGKQNIGWLTGKIAEFKGNNETLAATLAEARRAAESAEEKVVEAKRKIDTLTIERTQAQVKISRLQNALLQGESEQHYRDLSGLTAVKAVLESRQRFGAVHGIVAELGEVDEQYSLALEVAAASHLSSLVVGDESVARLAIEYLREHRLGFATFLPMSKIQGRTIYPQEEELLHEPGVIGFALSLIRFDQKYANIFSFVFGSTLVVEDLKVAERIGLGRARMVTLQGDIAEKNSVLRGGFRARRSNLGFSASLSLGGASQIEESRAELARANQDLHDLERTIETAQSELFTLTVAAQSARSQSEVIASQHTRVAEELASLQRELTVIESSPEEFGEHLEKLGLEKKELLTKIEEQKKDIADSHTAIERYNAAEEEKKQRVFALQETMQRLQNELNGIMNERNNLKIELAKLETKQEDLNQEVWNDLKMSLVTIMERRPEIVEAEALPVVADKIQKLKYQLSLIGGIEEDVTTEYATTKERFDFLTDQLKDLSSAHRDLTTMVEELDELMKKKRSSAFKKIRKEFNRYFQILFEGGSADLEEVYGEPPTEQVDEAGNPIVLEGENELTEEEKAKAAKKNKILTGIEVIANPPGKKIKYLNAMSGGERTLTSIALICAILHTNPSPFVVLDEVEAALDEANTRRFVRIMSELSGQSQFIIVTHNRVTMHAADALYGVVMNRDGISKLLSVKIEDVPEYEVPAQSVDK